MNSSDAWDAAMQGMNMNEEFIREVIAEAITEANDVANQTKCSCDVAIALLDESVRQFCWYRCKMCFGLVAETRIVEGTAHLVTGTIQ